MNGKRPLTLTIGLASTDYGPSAPFVLWSWKALGDCDWPVQLVAPCVETAAAFVNGNRPLTLATGFVSTDYRLCATLVALVMESVGRLRLTCSVGGAVR